MHRARYFTAAAVTALATLHGGAHAQQAPAAPGTGAATFVIFMGSQEVGREQVNLARTPSGWTITSTGRLVAPIALSNKRFEITYAPDWQPIELKIDAAVADTPLSLNTSFATTTAINEITRKGVTNTKNDQISARAVVLPNNFFAAYEALAARLSTSAVGTEIPVYVAPDGEIRMVVKSITPSTYQTPAGPVRTREFALSIQNPGKPLEASVTIDERSRLAKLEVGGVLSVTRQDLAVVATREQTHRNATDTDVTIPAAGFGLAGTLTTPAAQGRLEHPAVVLVADTGAIDRDGTVDGVPVLAQLAGQLSDKGFVVIRYDKRGVGQSGGRIEMVTLQDYADDVVAAVKWLDKRKDVDDKRISVFGHGEGAAVAMLAAAREKRIAGVAMLGAMGTTGRELILEQQQRLLDDTKVAESERAEKINLQKQILEATVTGKGWESLPPEVRRAVDTPLYRSLVTFDPAVVMKRIKQPVLILQGENDKRVPARHADALAELARARKDSPAVALESLPGLNHNMTAASAPGAPAAAISPEVARALTAWLATVAR